MERETVEVKPPQVSDETMKEMAKFFLRTSIPRILAEMKKEKEKPTISQEV